MGRHMPDERLLLPSTSLKLLPSNFPPMAGGMENGTTFAWGNVPLSIRLDTHKPFDQAVPFLDILSYRYTLTWTK